MLNDRYHRWGDNYAVGSASDNDAGPTEDGIFYVRNTGYDEKYNEFEAYIDNVRTKRYIRTVYGKTMVELEENAKKELAKLSLEYSKHR